MPRELLPNSPLVEVTAEVRFHGALSLLAQWGPFQNRVRKSFPKLMVPGAVPGTSPLLQHVHLRSEAEDEYLLLAVNSFAYGTSKYPGFESFKASFQRHLKTFLDNCDVGPVTRVGLRYINELLPWEAGAPHGHVHPRLRLQLNIQSHAPRFASQPQLTWEEDVSSKIKLRVSLAQPDTKGLTVKLLGGQQLSAVGGTRLDLDVSQTGDVPMNQVGTFLEAGHDAIENMFFQLITPEYETYLKG